MIYTGPTTRHLELMSWFSPPILVEFRDDKTVVFDIDEEIFRNLDRFLQDENLFDQLDFDQRLAIATHFAFLSGRIKQDENGNYIEDAGKDVEEKEIKDFVHLIQNINHQKFNSVSIVINGVNLKFSHPHTLRMLQKLIANHGMDYHDRISFFDYASKYKHPFAFYVFLKNLFPSTPDAELKLLLAKLYALAGVKSAVVGERKHVLDRISKWIDRSK